MNQHKLARFVVLLQDQAADSSSAIEVLQELAVSLDDGYCFFNLYQQWAGAFSFPGGRREALGPILEIARKLLDFSSDDTLALYSLPEWGKLVELRGPAETVMHKECSRCARQYPVIGTSGFYEANALVCSSCGSVYFRSYYDDSEIPQCLCGATYPPPSYGCPACGAEQSFTVREQSPYEYFLAHRFVRGPSA